MGRIRDSATFFAGLDGTAAATFKHGAAAGGLRHATVLTRMRAASRSTGWASQIDPRPFRG